MSVSTSPIRGLNSWWVPIAGPPFGLKRVFFSPFGQNTEHVLKRVGDSESIYDFLPSLRRSCIRARSARVRKNLASCARDHRLIPVELSHRSLSSLLPVSCCLDLFPCGLQQNEVWIAFTIILVAAISLLATQAQTQTCSRSSQILPAVGPLWVRPGW